MQELFQQLDTLELHFFSAGGSSLLLNIAIGIIMFGVALELQVKDFVDVLAHPKSILVGLLSQFVALPLVTFLICILLAPFITPTVALGMVLVAACPGGNISNFITNMARGNTALSVSLTAVSTFLTVIMTPLNFAIYGRWITQYFNAHSAQKLLVPLDIDLGQLFVTIFIILGIPIFLGLLTRHFMPKFTLRIIPYVKKISVLLFAAIVGVAIFQNLGHFAKYALIIFALVAFHNILAFATGYGIARLFGLSYFDTRAVTIETGIQNSGLGLALLFNPKIFPSTLPIGGMAFIAAGWGVWHIIAGIILAFFWSRKSAPKGGAKSAEKYAQRIQ